MGSRRKISAVLADFDSEVNRLKKLDVRNQREFASNKAQLHLGTEAVYFRLFRAFENYLEDVFVLYVMQARSIRGKTYASYLRPKNYAHARELLRSGKPFLDWANPEVVIERSEIYIQSGGPIKATLSSVTNDLLDMKAIRNHIAHNSEESRSTFHRRVRRTRGTLPPARYSPAEHLLAQNGSSGVYFLEYYMQRLSNVADLIAER